MYCKKRKREQSLETQMEKERQVHEIEKKARQRDKEKHQKDLQKKENQIRALERALNHQRTEAEIRREAFMDEDICRKINNNVRKQNITVRNSTQKKVQFTDKDAAALREAVLKHYANFETLLLSKYPKMNNSDLQLCQLYLLGLNEQQIATLQCKSYSAIKKRASYLKVYMGLKEDLSAYILII